jgi:hypothetical protein
MLTKLILGDLHLVEIYRFTTIYGHGVSIFTVVNADMFTEFMAVNPKKPEFVLIFRFHTKSCKTQNNIYV